MTRKKITWFQGVTNYNHKTSKTLDALKDLIEIMKNY